MIVSVLIARILLGLVFLAAGVSGFLISPPGMPGLAGAFQDVFFRSHWVLFVDAVMAAVGALFLINRYLGLALVISAALIFNILVFHITMMPSGIAPGIVVLALWLLVATHVRPHLEALLSSRVRTAK